MNNNQKELTRLQIRARDAISSLKALQNAYMREIISYDEVQTKGRPLIEAWNEYSKALAKATGRKHRPISLGYFLR